MEDKLHFFLFNHIIKQERKYIIWMLNHVLGMFLSENKLSHPMVQAGPDEPEIPDWVCVDGIGCLFNE